MAEQATNQEATPPDQETEAQNGRAWYFWPVVGLVALVGVFVAALVGALLIALLADPDDAANWVGIIRDIFIIVLAMEGMIMGLALIVLVIQLAALINLLQNEIQPIVDNTNETVTTVRGTAQFMSQNVVEPVIKFSALAAGIGGILREALGIRRTLRKAAKEAEKVDQAEKAEKKED
jgi:ABC-type sugar transport system permease subunit